MSEKLTENGRMVLNTMFDSIEDVKNNYFPDESEENIIIALNAIGAENDGDITSVMEIFFKGIHKEHDRLRAMSGDLWADLDLDRWTWELPRSTPGPYVAEHIPKPLIADWVKKWRPTINDALEKAVKYNKILAWGKIQQAKGLDGEVSQEPTYLELIDKLEAVKKWFEAEKYISDAGIRELETILGEGE